MKVAVISTEKVRVKAKGFNVHCFLWNEVGKTEINLRDFDGVILDVSDVGVDAKGIDWAAFKSMLNYRIALDVLRTSKSFIVVVGNPLTNGRDQSIAYSLGLNVKQVKGGGTSIKQTEYFKGSPYRGYLAKVARYDYTFEVLGQIPLLIDKAANRNLRNDVLMQPYLENRAGYTIATSLELIIYRYEQYRGRYDQESLHEGSIIFLPSADVPKQELVKTILLANSDDQIDDEPEWASQMTVYGQAEVDEKMRAAETALVDISRQKLELEQQKTSLRKPLEILYAHDKALETPVKSVLRSMGLTIIEPDASNKVEFRLTHKGKKFAVEVKSTTHDTVDLKGLRQVVDWQNDAFDETNEDHKGLLITSAEYDKPLDERKGILHDNLQEYAVKKDIAVLTVADLYAISQDVARGEVGVDKIIDDLYSSSGLFQYKHVTEPESQDAIAA